MSTANGSLTVRGIDIEVVYKDIKNLHIGVYPPAGRVRVAAPKRLDEDRVRLAVIQRLSWIKQQQKQLQDAARQSEREMVTRRITLRLGVSPPAQGHRATRSRPRRSRSRPPAAVHAGRIGPGGADEGAPADGTAANCAGPCRR